MKKLISMLLALCMVLAMGIVAFAEGTIEVATYEELVAAFDGDKSANVKMTTDITADATQSFGYGKAGIVLNAGAVLDGNGFKLTINGANGTWDSVIAMKGGEVKNLTIAGAFRGVFMPGADGDVVIDSCVFEDVVYTFNSDAGNKNYTVTIKNSALNGWTSFSDVHKSVTFENCTFGEGSGYAFCRPYQATTFTGCDFEEGFEFDNQRTDASGLEFNDCKYADEPLSAENNDMFYLGGKVVIDGSETDVTNYEAQIGDTKYLTLAEAFKNVKENETIIILSDVTISEDWDCRENGAKFTVPVTIDGKEHTLKLTGKVDDRNWNTVFRFEEEATVKNLTVDASEATDVQRGISSKLSITVDNCTFIGNGTSAKRAIIFGEGAGDALSSVTATVTGSKFIDWNYGVSDNQSGKDAKSVTITGSTFENASVLVSASETIKFNNNTLDGGWVNISSYSVPNELSVTATGNTLESSYPEYNTIKASTINAQEDFTIKAVAIIGDKYYATLAEAISAVGSGDVVIELLNDATLDYNAREAYGTDDTASVTINGNGKTLTLNQKNSDWSSLGLKNPNAKFIFKNMTIEKTGYGDTSGAWNTHTINVTSKLDMEEVTVNNSINVEKDANLKNVTINEANDYYGLWITADGQTVNAEGLEINGGRGIKIADQYVDAPAKVTLNVKDSEFTTAKKAAVLVSSKAGADITADNVNIENVAEDKVNFVWVDEDWIEYYGETTVEGASVVGEADVAGDIIRAYLHSNGRIMVDMQNVTYYKNVTLNLYSGEELLTVSRLNTEEYGPGYYAELTGNIGVTDLGSDTWPVDEWTPYEGVVPTEVILVIDGTVVDSVDIIFNGNPDHNGGDELDKDEWDAVGGINPAPLVKPENAIVIDLTGKDKTEDEANPNTGAPVMMPVAAVFAALSGAAVLKRK